MATTTPERVAGRTAVFHTLTVASVERLCDDAVAVTFDVPAELVEAFDFAAGQSLTLRRMIDGREHRRSYSICAPAGARPRIGVREIPDGMFSSWLVHEVRPATRSRCRRRWEASAPTRPSVAATCASRRGRASRRYCRSRAPCSPTRTPR